jgi:hypothetical protein
MSNTVLRDHLDETIAIMERRTRPETPVQALNSRFTGTEFGYEWVRGKPHAVVSYCGNHDYRLFPVDLQEVIDNQ